MNNHFALLWSVFLVFMVGLQGVAAQDSPEFIVDETIFEDRETVRQLQQSLNELGFSAGTPDGAFGPRTRGAIEQFAARWSSEPAALSQQIAEHIERVARSITQPPDRATFVDGPYRTAYRRTFQSDIRNVCENCNVANRILATGDLDGDGIDEIVIGVEMESLDWGPLDRDGPIQIINAEGQPWDRLDGPMPMARHVREAVIADFNGDGLGDLFIAAHGLDAQPFPGSPNVLVLSGPQYHTDVSATHLPQHNDMAHGVTGGDIDADGDIDLFVVTNEGTQDILPHMLVNDGSGRFSFSAPSNHLDPALVDFRPRNRIHRAQYSTARFEDYDGDGVLDLLLAARGEPNRNRASHSATTGSLILFGNGAGRFGGERMLKLPVDRWGLLTFTTDADAADLDNDGDKDLVLTLSSRRDFSVPWRGQFVQILMNEGGAYVDQTPERLWPQGYEEMANLHFPGNSYLVDLSGDGHPELIVQNREPNWRDRAGDTAIMIGLNDGTGHFSPVNPAWLSEWSGYRSREITPADLDGDGIFELVAYHLNGIYGQGADRTFGLSLEMYRRR